MQLPWLQLQQSSIIQFCWEQWEENCVTHFLGLELIEPSKTEHTYDRRTVEDPPPKKKCLTHQFKTCRIYQIRSLINTKNNVTCKATENLPWTLTHHLSESTNCPQTTITCPLVIGTKIWQTECQLTQYLKSLTKLSCCCSRPQISLIRFSSNLIKCSSEHLERQFWQVKL